MKKIEENSIGSRLKFARQKARLNQQFIADRLGVSKRTYIKYEQNESPIKKPMVKEVAEICEVSSDWLLTGQEPISGQNQESPRQQQAKNKKGLNSAENADFEVEAIKTTQTGNLGEENDEMYRLKFEEAQEKIIRLLEENADLKRLLIGKDNEKKAGKIRKTR